MAPRRAVALRPADGPVGPATGSTLGPEDGRSATVCFLSACTCGHAVEEHGHDPVYPASTACTECDCIAYEVACATCEGTGGVSGDHGAIPCPDCWRGEEPDHG